MEKKGVLRRDPGRSRNIVLTRQLPPLLEIPLYGTIPAGIPEGQEQRIERCLTIDPSTIELPRNARTFALEVRGDSMVDAGIFDRDVVIMDVGRTTQPRYCRGLN